MEAVKRYAAMKDSGMPWFNEVPSLWNPARIKTFLRNKSIKNHPEAEVLSLYRDWGIVPKNSRDDNHNVTAEDTSPYKYVEIGDLVINKMKAWQGSLAISEYEGIVSPAYYVCLFEGKQVNSRFIHHLFRCNAFSQRFECLSTGMRIGQWDLGIDDFLHEIVFLPSLNEQQAIATYLDDKCSAIDDIIASAHASIDDYKQLKASTIYEAVTKGLNPDAEMKDSGVEWIGDINSNYNIIKLKYLIHSYKAGPFGSSLITGNLLTDGKILVYTPEHIANKNIINPKNLYLQYSRKDEMKQFFVSKGDIIFPIVGSLGRAMIIADEMPEGVINQRLAKFKIKNNILNKKYFMWLFSESDFLKPFFDINSRGSIIINLTKNIIESIPIILPSVAFMK